MRLRRIAERQRATAVVGSGSVADRRLVAIHEVSEVDRVVAGEPGDRAGKGARSVELQGAGRAGVEADLGVRRGAEFEAAQTADLGLAAAGQRAVDHESARAAGRERAGIDDRVGPGVDDQRIRSARLDDALVLESQRSVTELPGARDRVVDIVEHRTRGAAEHYVLSSVSHYDLPASLQSRAAHQDLEVALVAGRIERDRPGIVDRAADRQDRTVADTHRPGIVSDRAP